jgi:hypothetical protein
MPSLARVATTVVFLLSAGTATAAPQPTARVPQRTAPVYTSGRPQQALTQATSPPSGLHARRPAVAARYEVGALAA